MRRRLVFALHLAAIVVLAGLLLTGLVVRGLRDRVTAWPDVTARLAGATECRVTEAVWAQPAGRPGGQLFMPPTVVTDPAVIRRVIAALPAAGLLRPADPAVTTIGPGLRFDFPTEDVSIGGTRTGSWVRVGKDYYRSDERPDLQDVLAPAPGDHPPK